MRLNSAKNRTGLLFIAGCLLTLSCNYENASLTFTGRADGDIELSVDDDDDDDNDDAINGDEPIPDDDDDLIPSDDDDDDNGGDHICSAADMNCPPGTQCDLTLGVCVATRCWIDEDCSEGDYCNVETGTCEPKTCVQDPSLCPECTVCDEETARCVPDTQSNECLPDVEQEQDCEAGEWSVPHLSLSDELVDFGQIEQGTQATKKVWVCNSGAFGTILSLSSISLVPGSYLGFELQNDSLPIAIPSGKQRPILISFRTNSLAMYDGKVRIVSDDINQPQVDIELTGSMWPVVDLDLDPRILTFLGESDLTVSATNTTGYPTVVEYPYLDRPNAQHFEILDCFYNGNEPFLPGQTKRMNTDDFITCTLHYDGNGDLDEESRDALIVFDFLMNAENPQSSTTHRNAILRPFPEPQCAIADAGDDQTVERGSVVFLDGSGSRDPNAENQQVVGYDWSWVSKPELAASVNLRNSEGRVIHEDQWGNEDRPHFNALIPGEYIIALTVNEPEPFCPEVVKDYVTVNMVQEDIRIELSWDDSSNMDLHFIEPGGYLTHSNGNNGMDCHFRNCDITSGGCPGSGCPGPSNAPDWGVHGIRSDDPILLSSSTEGGTPETILFSNPQRGDYLVAVENYLTLAPTSSQITTVRIWLRGVISATFTLDWRQQQECQDDNFCNRFHWKVATLRVENPNDIRIIPLGNVVPSD